MFSKKGGDVEAGSASEKSSVAVGFSDERAVPTTSEFHVAGDGMAAKLHRLARKMGVEVRGIERVPLDERSDTGMSKIGTLVSIT